MNSELIFLFRYSLNMYSGNISELQKVNDDSFNGVFMVIRDSIEYYNLQNIRSGTRTVQYAKERIYSMPYSVFARKGSCLMHEVNREINGYTDSGLISKWSTTFTRDYFSHKEKIIPKKFTMNQVSGIMLICICFYAISAFVLMLEMLSAKYRAIKIFIDFMTYDQSLL